MRRSQAYIFGGGLILLAFFISTGCSKNSNSDSDVIGNWIHSSDFDGNGRSEAVVFVIGENAYLTTGTTDRDRFKDLWEFNTTQGFWSQKADFPGVARNSAVAFAINNKGYVGTGFDGVNGCAESWAAGERRATAHV